MSDQVVHNMPALSLLVSLRGTLIGHREAIDDAKAFNERAIDLATELIGRVERDGLVGDDESLTKQVEALEAEVARLNRSNAALKRHRSPSKPPKPTPASKPKKRQRGLPPYGYAWGDGGELVAVENEQVVIGIVVRGRMLKRTWASLRREINDAGYCTRRGNPFSDMALISIYKSAKSREAQP